MTPRTERIYVVYTSFCAAVLFGVAEQHERLTEKPSPRRRPVVSRLMASGQELMGVR